MEKVVLLGTGGAVTDGKRDNVSLVFTNGVFHLLMECGGSTAHKLAKVGIPYETITDMIITHTHLDHFYGLPGFIFSMGYRNQERTTPLRIYCPAEAQSEIEALLDLFKLRAKFSFPVEIHGIPSQENALVFANEHVVVTATPVDHIPDMPTCAVKIVSRASGKSIVYSSDTGFSERLIRLAQHADLLLHECCGLAGHPIPEFHSTALQVGEVAKKSKVKKLVLIHLDTILNDEPEALIAQVHQHYAGDVRVASDFDEHILNEQ
jgi:ribonuclease Z